GVNAKVGPKAVTPAGNGGAPLLDCATAMGVFSESAPAGTTACEPPGPVTVPPEAPIPLGVGEVGDGELFPPPHPVARRVTAKGSNMKSRGSGENRKRND